MAIRGDTRVKEAASKRAGGLGKAPKHTARGKAMIDGLREVLGVMKSGDALEKHFTVRTVKLEIIPRRYGSDDLKAVREKLNASQALLAVFLGVTTQTVSLWEQGRRKVPLMACRYLDDIQEFPELWTKRLKTAKVAHLK